MSTKPPTLPPLPRYVVVDHHHGIIVDAGSNPTELGDTAAKYKRMNASDRRVSMYEYAGEVTQTDVANIEMAEAAEAAQRAAAESERLLAFERKREQERKVHEKEVERLIAEAEKAEAEVRRKALAEAEDLITAPVTRGPNIPTPDRRGR